MSLYNLIFKLALSSSLFFASSVAFAQNELISPRENETLSRSYSRNTWALSYISWTEMVDFENASTVDRGFANFYGNALSYEKEIFNKRYSGFAFQGDLIYAQANIGGSQTAITYQESYKKVMGAMAQARYTYRLNSVITGSVGPLALFRQVTIPESSGVTVKVGNPMNFGVIAALGVKLGQNVEFRQSFGTLSFKASTIWSLGLGYKY